MRFSGTPGKRFNLLLALFFLITNFATPAVFADHGEPINFFVSAYTCQTDPVDVSVAPGNIPGDCSPTTGVWFTVATDVGASSGGCTTDGTGQCGVMVPHNATVTVTEDTTTLVDVAPRANPIVSQAVSEPASVTFINLPVAPISQQSESALTEEPTPTEVLPPPVAIQTATEVVVPSAEPTATTIPTSTATSPPVVTSQSRTTTLLPATSDTTAETPSPTATSTTIPIPTDTSIAAITPTPTAVPTQAPVTTTFGTVTNTGGMGLRCRTQPNTSATIITVLPEGTRLEPRGAESNGWLPVRCGGMDGWIFTAYIAISTSTTAPSPTAPASGTAGSATVTNTGGMGLRCRTAPNTSATIITVLPEGSRIETRGTVSNGWLPVRCGGIDGWVSATYATVSTSATDPVPAPAPTTPPVSGTASTATVTGTGGGGLNCRTAPVSGAVITILPEGARVETRGAVTNGWLPVRCSGQDAWVSATYVTLSTSGTNPTPTPTAPSGSSSYAMVSGTGGGGLNCRTAPVSGSVITILPEGARIEVVASAQNGWAQVRCAGQVSWASAAYLVFNVGSGSGSGAVWIDVNLTKQYMIVYQGSNIIGQTYVSTGRYGFDTPPGTFYVNYKLPSQTMTGVLGGEYYYVEDVPWVMYFTDRGHAIHGAYWHNNFGYRMSHGCVNLPVGFSAWLYSVTPVGTRVYIHY
jgi:uncharacterized protein YgiM (DUF1202 family)